MLTPNIGWSKILDVLFCTEGLDIKYRETVDWDMTLENVPASSAEMVKEETSVEKEVEEVVEEADDLVWGDDEEDLDIDEGVDEELEEEDDDGGVAFQ